MLEVGWLEIGKRSGVGVGVVWQKGKQQVVDVHSMHLVDVHNIQYRQTSYDIYTNIV